MFGIFGAFNPRFYPGIARQPVGKTIGFLVVFILIISSLVSLKYTGSAIKNLSGAKNGLMKTCLNLRRNFQPFQ